MTAPAPFRYTIQLWPGECSPPADPPGTPPDPLAIETRVAKVPLRMIRQPDTSNETRVTAPEWFAIDPGAGITQLSLEAALLGEEHGGWDLSVGPNWRHVKRTTARGTDRVRAHPGSIRVLFPNYAEPFEFTCLFIENWPVGVPPLLGLHDVLKHVRITFDSTKLRPFGAVTFERYDTTPHE